MGKRSRASQPVDVAARLETDGYAVINDVVDKVGLAAIRGRVAYHLDHAREHDPTWRAGGTLHLDRLVDLDDAFDALWLNDAVLGAVEYLVGRDFWMSSMGLRAPTPGHGDQELHRVSGPPRDASHEHVTAIFALVPFTASNGATRLLPGSHRAWYDVAPAHRMTRHPDERIIDCPGGSALVFSEHVFHSGTGNTDDHRRDAIIASYHPRPLGVAYPSPPRRETVARLGHHGSLLLRQL